MYFSFFIVLLCFLRSLLLISSSMLLSCVCRPKNGDDDDDVNLAIGLRKMKWTIFQHRESFVNVSFNVVNSITVLGKKVLLNCPIGRDLV